jgi:hypothetical protein
MIVKPLDEITETDLNGLITASVAERKTIDYKQQLPDTNDAGKRELLADVSSFANTAGGDLIFGVTESAGLPTGIPGVQIANTDQEILRFDNIIRDGLSPRIRHTTRAVGLASGLSVLIIRAERSWYGPHRVVFKGDSRFYGRTTNGKYELDVTDLRNAFIFANTVAEKVAAFRSERIIAIENGRTLVPLPSGPLLAVHCLPLDSFASEKRLDVLGLGTAYQVLRPMGWVNLNGWGPRINFEGLICVASGDPPRTYTQVYRSGIIESVGEGFLRGFKADLIPSTLYERTVLDSVRTAFKIMQHLACNPPAIVNISLIGVRGLRMATDFNTQMNLGGGSPIDRDVLALPGILVEDISADPSKLLKSTLDLVWNACGYPSSPNFGANGEWREGTF